MPPAIPLLKSPGYKGPGIVDMWSRALIALAVILAAAIILFRPMRIPREPDREGAEDEEAFLAYDRTSRWPFFVWERHIIMNALEKTRLEGRLVDIGCGPGYLAARLSRKYPQLKVTALDISEVTLAIARRNWPPDEYKNLEFLAGDAQRLPLTNASADFIVSSLSLHHWQDARQAFTEIQRVLKPGGRFLVFDLRRDSPAFVYYTLKIGQALVTPEATRRTNGAVGSFWAAYTPAELASILDGLPLDNLRITRRFGWMIIEASRPEAK
jgi:ubiquinone/menaquinone biosynthesis C-methylase UbiE